MSFSFEDAKKATLEYFNNDEIATDVFLKKYALKDAEGNYLEDTPDAMHKRLAKEFARIEKKYENPMSEEEIYGLFKDFKWIVPQGSPMSAIGNPYKIQSASNCFVVQSPRDSYGGVCYTDQQEVQIAKRRGGIGFDISTLRPRGTPTANAAGTSDGIEVFMERYSNSCREVAQCIAEGERVLTNSGLKQIQDVDPKNDKVWTKKGWVRVLDKISSNNKKIFKLETSEGFSIKTSEDHIFITENNGELKECKLKDLEEGDSVVLIPGVYTECSGFELDDFKYTLKGLNKSNRLNNDVTLPKVLSPDLAYILGVAYGDGSIEYDSFNEPLNLSIACGHAHPKVQEHLVSCIKKVFNINASIRKGDGAVNRVNINSKIVLGWLKNNNILNQKSHEISMPLAIFQSPASVQLSFLSGFFDADGTNGGPKKGYTFTTTSYCFAKDIQTLLMSTGIISKLHIEDRTKKEWRNLFSVSVTGTHAQKKLIEYFELGYFRSQKIYNKFISKRDNYLTPYKAKTIGVKQNDYNFIPSDTYISANAFNKIASENNLDGLLIKSRIKSIQEEPSIKTYDLSLESEHLFWCEGFYVHNSGRRGALLLSLSVHHPDIETFIKIKRDLKRVTGANISIRLTDEFMNAVKKGKDFELRFPVEPDAEHIVKKKISSKYIWDEIIKSARDSAEPGLLFWDNVKKNTPADCYEDVGYGSVSTNPCGEINLSPYDSCRLMVLNLFSFVIKPFTKDSFFDFESFREKAVKAQRLMDDMVDLEVECIDKIIAKIESDPEPESIKAIERDLWHNIKHTCINGRRTGLGITALGDTLAALGVQYGSKKSIEETEKIYRALAVGAYESSVTMAKERGAFPVFDYNKEKDHNFISRIINESDFLKENYPKYGRRNIALTTTAPTGSVSIMTQTTSGIEPAFMLGYTRRRKINPEDKGVKVDFVDDIGDRWQEYKVYHHKYKMWMDISGKEDEKESPYYGGLANDIDWVSSVKLQAAAQKWICHAISRTCNLPNDVSYETVSDIYMEAWKSGCKGFTVYRDGSRSGVLVSTKEKEEAPKFSENRAPKRPQSLPCDIHQVNIKGEAWTVLIGLMDDRPYEIFGGLSSTIEIPKKYKKGMLIKHPRKSVVSVYDLKIGEGEDTFTIKNVVKVFDNPTEGAFTRTISLALRHGAPIQFLTEQLQKDDKDSDMFSFSRVIARVLKQYITDGTKASGKCPECGSDEVMYIEGCLTCPSCGYGKCG